MTDCARADFRDQLPDLVHGRLDASAELELRHHLATCPDCARELELVRAMRGVLSEAPAIDVARIVGAVTASRTHRPGTSARPVARLAHWRAAAAIAAVAVGGLSYTIARQAGWPANPSGGGPQPTPLPVVAEAPASVPAEKTPPARASRPRRPATPAVTGAPRSAHSAASSPETGLVFGGGVSDLSTAQLRVLLDAVDSVTSVPSAEPAPILQVEGAGGRSIVGGAS